MAYYKSTVFTVQPDRKPPGNLFDARNFLRTEPTAQRGEISSMDHNEVRELEEACERAIAEVLRKHYPHALPHGIRHLMAKAAVTVLEAVEESKAEE